MREREMKREGERRRVRDEREMTGRPGRDRKGEGREREVKTSMLS